VAATISSGLRTGDTAYRYGGEEFLVVLPEQDAETAAAITDRLRQAVEALGIPHADGGPGGVLTVSAGVAVSTGSGDADGLLKAADKALYTAKSEGRNRVALAAG
jgi:diguanylate cyclase (GGDEF)-like protein